MAADDRGERREPYQDANVNSYSVIQHSFQEVAAVAEFSDWTDRAVLHWLYGCKANAWGLVEMRADGVALYLGAEGEDAEAVAGCLADLEAKGHLHRDKFFIVLRDWRRFMGVDNAKRDAAGRLAITKGMARVILTKIDRLTPKGLATYLAACGLDDARQLAEIIERPDPRGGHNRKDEAKPKQSESKAEAKPKQSQSKAGAKNKKNRNRKEEPEQGVESEKGGGGEAPAPSTSQNDNGNGLGQALLREFQVRNPKPAMVEGLQAFSTAFRRVFKRLPDASTAPSAARRMRADMIKWSEGIDRRKPYYLGNVLEPAFAAYLAERYGDSTHAGIFWNEIGGDGPAAPSDTPSDTPSDPPRRARRRRKPDLGLSKHPEPPPAEEEREIDPLED